MQFSTRLPCIDANLVVAWFDGALDPKSRAGIEEHVDACDECRALLVELGREIVQEEDRSGEGSVLAPLTIGARVGRYVILEWLGAGGMGVVYGAYDPELERRIAIKLLRPDRAPQGGDPEAMQERLLREGQALARVSHPNVIAVHDVALTTLYCNSPV